MKIVALLVASTLIMPAALAQTRPAGSAPPPPGINDPGVHATAPAPAGSARHASPALPAMRDLGRDARGEPPPEVSVHQHGDDSVQEYRRNGQLYMVVITPKNGIAQTYMVDPEGRLVDEHGQKPTRPVMYKLIEWGKSQPAEAGSGGD